MPLKIYDGSKWIIAANVNVWNGTSWAAANGSVWDGSSWVQYHPGVYLPPYDPAPAYSTYAIALGTNSYASSTIRVFANGYLQVSNTTTNYGTIIANNDIWKLSGDVRDYDVKFINYVGTGGVISGSMTEGVAYSSSSDPYFGIEAYSTPFGTVDFSAAFDLQITANNNGTVLANTSVYLYVIATDPNIS